MRKILILFASLALSACAGNYQAPKYQVGQSFQDSFISGYKTSVPLPAGKWNLVGYSQKSNNVGKTMNSALLIQTEGNNLARFIDVLAPDDITQWGYLPAEFCKRTDVLHIVRRINQDGEDGGKQDCWGINHWRMTLGDNSDGYWLQAMNHMRNKGIRVPINALVVIYRKANMNRFVQVVYGFNPELEGFNPPNQADWSVSDWHKDRYYTDNDKVKYIQELKDWGVVWENRVVAGFGGGVSTSAPPPPTNQSGFDAVSEKLKQLKKLMEDGVITEHDYETRKQKILDGL